MARASALVGTAVVGAFALGPLAAQAADVANGRALAQQWCASCHTVDAAAATARDLAPSFGSIARRPDVSESALIGWLATPHPAMPDFELSRAAIGDLVAYIRSLK